MGDKTDVWQGTLAQASRKRLDQETREWEQTTSILARFLSPGEKLS